MGLFNRRKRTKETNNLEMDKPLRPWGRKKATYYLANDVIEFIGKLSEDTQIPRGRLIDMAMRRFKRDLERGIEDQAIEVPEGIIRSLKLSKVIVSFLEEDTHSSEDIASGQQGEEETE